MARRTTQHSSDYADITELDNDIALVSFQWHPGPPCAHRPSSLYTTTAQVATALAEDHPVDALAQLRAHHALSDDAIFTDTPIETLDPATTELFVDDHDALDDPGTLRERLHHLDPATLSFTRIGETEPRPRVHLIDRHLLNSELFDLAQLAALLERHPWIVWTRPARQPSHTDLRHPGAGPALEAAVLLPEAIHTQLVAWREQVEPDLHGQPGTPQTGIGSHHVGAVLIGAALDPQWPSPPLGADPLGILPAVRTQLSPPDPPGSPRQHPTDRHGSALPGIEIRDLLA